MWETQLRSKSDNMPFKFSIIEWHVLRKNFTTKNLSQAMVSVDRSNLLSYEYHNNIASSYLNMNRLKCRSRILMKIKHGLFKIMLLVLCNGQISP